MVKSKPISVVLSLAGIVGYFASSIGSIVDAVKSAKSEAVHVVPNTNITQQSLSVNA